MPQNRGTRTLWEHSNRVSTYSQGVDRENRKACWSPKMGTGSVDRLALQWRLVVPTVPVPFFGRRHWGAWKKGTGTEPQGIFDEVDIDPGSEPVPVFHSILPTVQSLWW